MYKLFSFGRYSQRKAADFLGTWQEILSKRFFLAHKMTPINSEFQFLLFLLFSVLHVMNGIRNSGCWSFRNCFAVKKSTQRRSVEILILVSNQRRNVKTFKLLKMFYFDFDSCRNCKVSFFPPFGILPFEAQRRSNELWLDNSITLSYVAGNGIRFVGREISFFQLHKQFELPDCSRSGKKMACLLQYGTHS